MRIAAKALSMVLLPPFIRRELHDAFKSAGKMKLIGIAYLAGNIPDGHTGGTQVFACFVDPISDEKFLGTFLGHFFK